MFKTELPPKSDENGATHKLSEKRGGNASESLSPPPLPQISEINLRRFRHASPPSSLGQTEEGEGDGRSRKEGKGEGNGPMGREGLEGEIFVRENDRCTHYFDTRGKSPSLYPHIVVFPSFRHSHEDVLSLPSLDWLRYFFP